MLPVRGATVRTKSSFSVYLFQSMLPVRGATHPHRSQHPSSQYFNPCSPCGERRLALHLLVVRVAISIHAPRAGSDCCLPRRHRPSRNFNPCSPCGERPAELALKEEAIRYFNPCSPCGERLFHLAHSPNLWYFNPCSPCGERLGGLRGQQHACQFQSMLPVRGATGGWKAHILTPPISIHAPRAGSDSGY